MKYLSGLLVALGAWTAASAGTLVSNCSTVNSSSGTLNDTIVCPQFGTSLGPLQSVEILISGSASGTVAITNHNGVDEIVTITSGADFTISPLPGFTFSAPLFSALTTITPLVPGDNVPHNYSYSASGSGELGINTNNLAPYIGTGTFGIGVGGVINETVSGKAVGTFGVAFTDSATATVTYTFTPEPATFLLTAACLAGLAGVARFRRSY